MSKPEEITVAGEWLKFVGDDLALLGDGKAATMWAAGFACALHTMLAVSRSTTNRGEFRENMQRLLAEAEKALQRGRGEP